MPGKTGKIGLANTKEIWYSSKANKVKNSKGLKYMSALTIVFTVLQVLSGLAVTVVVLMQSGKSAGLSGAISGGAETFLSKGKAKTWDAKLAKATKWFALAFVVLTLILNLI